MESSLAACFQFEMFRIWKARLRNVRVGLKNGDKKTSPSLDKVLPIEKRLCLFYIKLKKLFCAQIKAKNLKVHALAGQLRCRIRWPVLVGQSGSKSRAYFYSQSIPAKP